MFMHCVVRDTVLIVSVVCALMLIFLISFIYYVYR